MSLKTISNYCMSTLAGFALAVPTALATLPNEELFQHESMPSHKSTNIVTISDIQIPYTSEGRVHFVDIDKGNYLGALNTGYWYSGVVLPKTRNEIISPETYFERGTRGKRTDIVAFYDPITFKNTGEVIIPSKRMTAVKPQATSALTDDEKFLAVLNVTPATSMSIVDLDKRQFVTEIELPGCTYIYPVGKRTFNSICADGSFMKIELDEQGNLLNRSRRQPSFDPIKDPITNGAVRIDNTWHHLSREGNVYHFTTAEDGSVSAEHWSLLNQEERDDNWRIAGHQHLAIHKESQRLYALMIQGDPEKFEDPTDQVWVYDLKTRKRVEIVELERPALFINVSQDSNPKLFAVAVDFQMPFVFSAYLFLTEGYDHMMAMNTFSFDIYNLSTGELQSALPRIGKFPNLIQPWE